MSKPAETPIEQLRALVSLVEAARLQSRPLTAEEDVKIEAARDSKAPLVAIAAMQAGDADRTELCSLGHRLWAALGFAASEKKQDARCRSLACELYAAGSKGSSESVSQEMLAIHWALAGRAWVLASDDQKALLCFAEALQPFRAQPQRCHAKLAELAAQTYLWMADVHFRQATYKEAFADLAGVRELLALRPEIRPAQQNPQSLNLCLNGRSHVLSSFHSVLWVPCVPFPRTAARLDGLLFHCHKQAGPLESCAVQQTVPLLDGRLSPITLRATCQKRLNC